MDNSKKYIIFVIEKMEIIIKCINKDNVSNELFEKAISNSKLKFVYFEGDTLDYVAGKIKKIDNGFITFDTLKTETGIIFEELINKIDTDKLTIVANGCVLKENDYRIKSFSIEVE